MRSNQILELNRSFDTDVSLILTNNCIHSYPVYCWKVLKLSKKSRVPFLISLFNFQGSICCLFRNSLPILPRLLTLVNTFLKVFWKKFSKPWYLVFVVSSGNNYFSLSFLSFFVNRFLPFFRLRCPHSYIYPCVCGGVLRYALVCCKQRVWISNRNDCTSISPSRDPTSRTHSPVPPLYIIERKRAEFVSPLAFVICVYHGRCFFSP